MRLSGRLTAGTLVGEFFARFFGAESGLLPTIWGLARRPGRTARAYLDGRRRRLLSPLALFVLCATAQIVGLWLLRDLVTGEVIGSLPPQRTRTVAAIATGLLIGFAGFLGSIVLLTGLALDPRFWR